MLLLLLFSKRVWGQNGKKKKEKKTCFILQKKNLKFSCSEDTYNNTYGNDNDDT